MSRTAGALTPGFADPVHDAQRVFRSVLEAMARPLQPQEIRVPLAPPAPLSAELGAVVLALCDEQTPLWCDAALREAEGVMPWIRFHTGASFVEEAGWALFCLVSRPAKVPAFEELELGTDEQPHLSATVIVDGGRPASETGAAEPGPAPLTASGPGIQGALGWDGAGLPEEFLQARSAVAAAFPRGADVLMTGAGVVLGLPRTTVLTSSDSSASGGSAAGAPEGRAESLPKGGI